MFWRLNQQVFFFWCMEFYWMLVILPNGMDKGASTSQKKNLIVLGKKNTLRSCQEILLTFFLLPFCGQFKSQDNKSHQF